MNERLNIELRSCVLIQSWFFLIESGWCVCFLNLIPESNDVKDEGLKKVSDPR